MSDAERSAFVALALLLGHPSEAPVVEAIAAAAQELHLEPGDAVREAGACQADLVLLVEGLLELREGDEVLERLEAGRTLLLPELPDCGVEAVRVVAGAPSLLLRFPAADLERMRLEAPLSWWRVHRFTGRQVPSVFLTTTDLFRGLDPRLLHHLDEPGRARTVEAGAAVQRRGAPADALHVVLHGSLGVLPTCVEDGAQVRTIGRGLATDLTPVLLGEPHPHTVVATRDSVVVEVPRSTLEGVVDRLPSFGLHLARAAVQEGRRRPDVRRVRTVTVASDVPGFADELLRAVHACGTTATLASSARVRDQVGADVGGSARAGVVDERVLEHLADLEDRFDLVVYDCTASDAGTDWARIALRQADTVLVVADTTRGAGLRQAEQELRTAPGLSRVELVLVRPEHAAVSGTDRWLRERSVAAHHHVRAGRADDLARLARTLTGKDFGVALSGGGARGFAHIGAFKALAAHGIAVDHVGGTSMGSVIAGQQALGWDVELMVRRNREEFPAAAVLGDFTLPVLALGKGRSAAGLLRSLFGDVLIEDLPLPYFCVTTNLSTSRTVVHDRGPLWTWSRASSSVPGIGPPVPWRGDLLVDGGLLNNLPVDVMRARCHGPVMGVDVTAQNALRTLAPDLLHEQTGWSALRRMRSGGPASEPTIMQVLTRATTVSSVEHLRTVDRHADLHVVPDVADVGPFAWDAIDRVVEAGYRATSERLEAWEGAGRPEPAPRAEEVVP